MHFNTPVALKNELKLRIALRAKAKNISQVQAFREIEKELFEQANIIRRNDVEGPVKKGKSEFSN